MANEIKYQTQEPETEVYQTKPKKRPTSRPEPTPQIQEIPRIDTTKPIEKEIREKMGFDTLNPTIYKFTNMLLILEVVFLLVSIIYAGIIYIFLNTIPWALNVAVIGIFISLVSFGLTFVITRTSLKRNDVIIIRKYSNGAGAVTKTNLGQKQKFLFNPKDKTTWVTINWQGAIIDILTGCKMIQVTEGKKVNDNLNQQISESEWDKAITKLTKAKSVADLAEAELFNQNLFGMSWQDIVLVITFILCIGIIGYLVVAAPGAVAKETVKQLLDGSLQQAIGGILYPATVPTG